MGIRHDNKFPDVGQLKIDEIGRLAFHRKDLKFEERDRYTFNLGYQQREVFYGIGLRYEDVDNLMKPRWVKWGYADSTNSLEDVYTWTNIDNVNSLDWLLQVGFRLGNWKFYLERGETLDRSLKLIDTPELYYKGSIHAVTFDLGAHGTRTGGGELVQSVTNGCDAVAPEVSTLKPVCRFFPSNSTHASKTSITAFTCRLADTPPKASVSPTASSGHLEIDFINLRPILAGNPQILAVVSDSIQHVHIWMPTFDFGHFTA